MRVVRHGALVGVAHAIRIGAGGAIMTSKRGSRVWREVTIAFDVIGNVAGQRQEL